jgi:hypothetical protein
LDKIQVLNYIKYNKQEAKNLITKELKWVDYVGKHYESVFTKFYQSYILPVKFNIDKRKPHLSTLICSGQITREKALEELKTPSYNNSTIDDDKSYIAKKLGITINEFDALMKQTPKLHSDFKTEKKLWENYFKTIKLIKFWKK